ncbi:DUF7558 family protein [Haloferax larsenii]
MCVNCAIQSNPDPDVRDHYACDSLSQSGGILL